MSVSPTPVGDAFDDAAPGRTSARQLWELRQQVRAVTAERDELLLEVAQLRDQLIVAYQRLAAGGSGPDVPARLLQLVCEEANRIRLEALRYAQRIEHEVQSHS